MYELKKTAFGKYTHYELSHAATGNSFSIVPERGANVLNIHFGKKNILDGYNTPEELEAGMQLAHLLLTDPTLEETAFARWKTAQLQNLEAMEKNPSQMFSKLNVRNRTQAMARARQLKLL